MDHNGQTNSSVDKVRGWVKTDFSTNQRYLVIEECPFCGQEHIHGLGKLGDGPVEKFVDVRISHCDDHIEINWGSYRLDRFRYKRWKRSQNE